MNLTFSINLSILPFTRYCGFSVYAKTQEKSIKVVGFLATLPALMLVVDAFLHYQVGARFDDFSMKSRGFDFALRMQFNMAIYSQSTMNLG